MRLPYFKPSEYFLWSLFTLIFLACIYLPPQAAAQDQVGFWGSYDITVDVQDDSSAKITNTITVTNALPNWYLSSYPIKIPSAQISQEKALDSNSAQLNIKVKKEEGATSIETKFEDILLGTNKSRTFNLSYLQNNFLNKKGQIWEFLIPKLTFEESQVKLEIKGYKVKLRVPKKFEPINFVSPTPNSTKGAQKMEYLFEKNETISGGFGSFQVFDFELNYHLENSNLVSTEEEITLPPDTPNQLISITSYDPKPTKLKEDPDGNFLAYFKLAKKSNLNVKVKGQAKVSAKGDFYKKKQAKEELEKYLKSEKYWEKDDPQIQSIAKNLNDVKDIYLYVISRLTYGYDRVEQGELQRLGAKGALINPNSAICTEFSDLFVALARAKGIPARGLIGFAFTENKRTKPVTIGGKYVNDILHAWAEYYDYEKGLWVPVDPTWGATTGGINYFDSLDTNHLVFVINGNSSETPYPAGAYKLKGKESQDIFIKFSDAVSDASSKLEMEIKTSRISPLLTSQVDLIIRNKGQVSLHDVKLSIASDNLKIVSQDEVQLGDLIPLGEEKVTLKLRSENPTLTTKGVINLSVSGIEGGNVTEIKDTKEVLVSPFFTINLVHGVAIATLVFLFTLISFLIYGRIKKSKVIIQNRI